MRTHLFTAALVAVSMIFAGQASADLVINTNALTTDIISSSGVADGGVGTRLIDEGSNSNHARGQWINALGGANDKIYRIDTISFQKQNDQTYTDSSLTLRIFTGTLADWTSGTGHTTAANGNNYYVGTSVTPIATQTEALATTILNNDWITFELDAPVFISAADDFGFFFEYDRGTAADPDDIDHRESQPGSPNGNRLSVSNTAHAVSGARRLDYIIQGESLTVPEPSSVVVLGLSAFALIRRRR